MDEMTKKFNGLIETAGDFTKRVRTQPYDPKWKHTLIIQTEDRDELCDRLDRETIEHLQIQQATEAQFNAKLDTAEAINKDLLEALKKLFNDCRNESADGPRLEVMQLASDAIAKATHKA